jgi:hypothetical protein
MASKDRPNSWFTDSGIEAELNQPDTRWPVISKLEDIAHRSLATVRSRSEALGSTALASAKYLGARVASNALTVMQLSVTKPTIITTPVFLGWGVPIAAAAGAVWGSGRLAYEYGKRAYGSDRNAQAAVLADHPTSAEQTITPNVEMTVEYPVRTSPILHGHDTSQNDRLSVDDPSR